MEQIENGLPSSQTGFEQTLQLLEAFREMTAVMMELIHKPAVNNTYNYQVYQAPVYNYNGHQQEAEENGQEADEDPPTPEEMVEACELTLAEGLWWGDASWGTAYQVFRQRGYSEGIDRFVEDVKTWPWKKSFPKKCNKFSVGDSARRGAITWPLAKWKEKGAQSREIVLGERIYEILSKKRLATLATN